MKRLIVAAFLAVSFSAATVEASQESRRIQEELSCLSKTIYWEARGEGERGMRLVAHVIMNRVGHSQFPNTVCGVVNQRRGGRCQFSVCRMLRGSVASSREWDLAQKMARSVYYEQPDITNGAIYFHARSVSPSWRRSFEEVAEHGGHIFYRER